MNSLRRTEVLPTQNAEYGYFGTLQSNITTLTSGDVQNWWEFISMELANRFELTAEDVRTFLDSKTGRHIADHMTGTHDGIRHVKCELPTWIESSVNSYKSTI